jgi:hypothetical protein
MIDPMDLIIDRSPADKAKRLENMRAELVGLGYSIVTTEWLNALMAELPPVAVRPVRATQK